MTTKTATITKSRSGRLLTISFPEGGSFSTDGGPSTRVALMRLATHLTGGESYRLVVLGKDLGMQVAAS